MPVKSEPPKKRGRGRPKGSLSKTKIEKMEKELEERKKMLGETESQTQRVSPFSVNLNFKDIGDEEIEPPRRGGGSPGEPSKLEESSESIEKPNKEEPLMEDEEDDDDYLNDIDEDLNKISSNPDNQPEDDTKDFDDDLEESSDELRQKIQLIFIELRDVLAEKGVDEKNFSASKLDKMKRPQLVRAYKCLMKTIGNDSFPLISTLYKSSIRIGEHVVPRVSGNLVKLQGLGNMVEADPNINKLLKILDISYSRSFQQLCSPEMLLLMATLSLGTQCHFKNVSRDFSANKIEPENFQKLKEELNLAKSKGEDESEKSEER